MRTLKVKEVMTPGPLMIKPEQTVREAAVKMKQIDCGVLPVGEQDRVVGMITDRDITIRVIAAGKDPAHTSVQDVMTKKVYACDEDVDVEDAAEEMREANVSRLVVTKGEKATGIVSLSCLLRAKGDRHKSDKVLHELLRPAHAQTKQSTRKTASAGAGCESCDE